MVKEFHNGLSARFNKIGFVMNEEQQMVKDFHKKYGCEVGGHPSMPSMFGNTLMLRMRLIMEEAAECLKACSNNDIEELVDGLCDLLYVTYGTAVTIGVDLEPIFAEVHRANMDKVGGTDAGGKIKKGEDFVPPKIADELEKQGWPRFEQDTASCFNDQCG